MIPSRVDRGSGAKHLNRLVLELDSALGLGAGVGSRVGAANIDNRWSGDGSIVVGDILVLGSDSVDGSRESLRDGCLSVDELDGDAGQAVEEEDVDIALGALGEGEGDWLANGWAGSGDSQGRERYEWQHWVALGAANEERSSEGDDLGSSERGLESVGDSVTTSEFCNQSLVSGLDSENGSSSGEVLLVRDELGLVEIGTDTDVLDDASQSEEGWDISVRESVLAGSSWGLSTGGENCLECGDVGSFLVADLEETLSDDSAVSSSLEVIIGELGESVRVELGLEVLEGKSVLEDLDVDSLGTNSVWYLSRGSGGSEGKEGGKANCDG